MGTNDGLTSIFGKALDLPAPARAAYLDPVCAGNPRLRAEVESLLKAYQEAGRFLQDSSPAPAATVDDPMLERTGTVIGPYKQAPLLW
jgi:hypothetical protein